MLPLRKKKQKNIFFQVFKINYLRQKDASIIETES